ncbi:GRF1-interacting factor 1-like isoform X2 [Lotus japonicus]|uniref:GRF1-interacting factor 1-like isoform X2 n=1 Tax=Lotus japonicus TaxID=34305 RepID=UPI002589368D|nr:GRF1-interacting factor 1-like isoform X2 [Lotus japonicus]
MHFGIKFGPLVETMLLEENNELFLAIMELQNQGRFIEITQYQIRLQNNLIFLAKLADNDPQAKTLSQEQDRQQSHVAMSQQQQWQGMQSQPHVAMSQKQQGQGMQPQSHVAMSWQQQGQGTQPQPHVAMSQQQPDHASLTLPMVGMNDEQQQQEKQHLPIPLQKSGLSTSNQPFQMNEQQHNLQAFFRQQLQHVPRTSESMYQASQTRLGSMTDAPPSNHFGSGMGPSWS